MMQDIPILMLHSVNDKHNLNPMGSLSCYPSELEGYLRAYKTLNYQMISMSDLLKDNYRKKDPFIVLTFDDGYKDNLYCAKDILKKYNARGTIFINPNYCATKSNKKSTWGFMSYEELQEAEESNVFDLQAHSLTHEFIFKSDKIIDFYTKDMYDQYYWLAWMLYEGAPNTWGDDAYKYRDKIPEGYPIFEYDRRLSHQKFAPDQAYVERCIHLYKDATNKEQLVTELNSDKIFKGTLESHDDYLKQVEYQLDECKTLLENKLSKKINIICFPGGGYNKDVLEIAEKVGYKCYMNASSHRSGNNFDHLKTYRRGQFIEFNRTSLSHFENHVLASKFVSQLIAMISLGDYQKIKIMVAFKNCLKLIKNWRSSK